MSDISFTSFSGTTRPTPFGIYDSDTAFQADADDFIYYFMRTMGAPEMDAEIDLRSLWAQFEAATVEYSSEINKNHARNVLLDLLGQGTGSLSGSENVYTIGNSMEMTRNLLSQYSNELGSGQAGQRWITGSITLTPGTQRYDLWNAVSGVLTGANAGKKIVFRKIHHYEKVASYRFFDTTSVLNYLGNAVGFESYSPETIFYLLPIWEDVLRGTQLELNQRVRRSNYSFNLQGFELTLFPTPVQDDRLYFEYTISPRDPADPTARNSLSRGVMSNISNVAFGHIGYRDINSVGKTWIWKMALAMSKEVLGHLYSKYKSLPIGDGATVELNGDQLIQRAREDQANLRLELKELLEQMSYKNLMAERQELMDLATKDVGRVPQLIYISK